MRNAARRLGSVLFLCAFDGRSGSASAGLSILTACSSDPWAVLPPSTVGASSVFTTYRKAPPTVVFEKGPTRFSKPLDWQWQR